MKKLLAIVLVASFAFVGAINASAVTIEELQAQIATLLQQIAALSGTSTPAPATTTCFSTDLQQGMTSNDVKLLQEKLGVINTGYFGPLTLSAVKTFQGQNSIPTTGYVGPMTRAALNAKYCVTTPVTTPTTTVTTAPVAGATEGTLSAVISPTFVETALKKGDSQKAIVAAKLEAKNSNIAIHRVDFQIFGTSIQPWKTFSSFELYANGSLVKGIPALKDNLIENRFGGDYTLRFDGISFNVPKDGSVDLVLKVSMLSNPENQATNYRFAMTTNAIRGKDSAGIDQYAVTAAQSTPAGSPENYSSHTFKSSVIDASTAAQKGTITASLNTASPKLGFVIGNRTATTSNVELLKTDFKAENRDVTIKGLKVTMADAGGLASAIKLYDGSTLLASVAGANGDVTFTNLSILIAKDTTKTLTVKADLKPIDGVTIAEGLTLTAAITATDAKITAIDSNDDMLATANMSNNTVTGRKQTGYTKAPTFTLVSANIVKTTQAGSPDIADATIVLNVTANGGDIYIKKTDNAAEKFIVTGPSAAADYQYTSTADNGGTGDGFHVIRNGETKSVTITGRMSGGNAFNKMVLTNAKWSVNSDGSSEVNSAVADYDFSTFETTSVYLAN